MGRWKLIFEYDGGSFKGWQKQPDQRTVEGEVETALSTLYQTEIDIIGQGRTDAGVHAKAQAAHADLPESFQKQELLHAMKGLLPHDVALIDAERVKPDFHARFDAVSRSYKYFLIGRKAPLFRKHAWCCSYPLDDEILSGLAGEIAGEHDFLNFCIPPVEPELTTICTIYRSKWEKKGEKYLYHIEGNRFLRHMVRRLVGSMVQAASKKINTKDFKSLLNGEEVKYKGHSAPAHGLYLDKVTY